MASFSSEVNNVPDPTSIRPVKEPRTIPANRSMETLFENISSAAQATGKYLYNSAKEDITNTVENVVETQDSKYGYGVEGAINSARQMQGRQAPEQDAIASNPELQSAQSYVQKVQAAKQQGIIPDSLYWAQLNIKAKELRARYPGWDEEINQIFDDVTGNHRLESRMRMAVDEEQKRMAASGGKEDPEQKRIDADYQKFNGLIAQQFPSEYKNWYSLPKEKQLDILQNVAKIDGSQKLDEANLKHMEVLKAQGGDTKQLAAQAYYTHVNSAVDAAIRTKGPNANSDSMVKQLDQMTAPGYMPSDKDADLINQHLAQVKIDLQKQFLQDRNKYIANGLTAEEADKAEKSALQTVDTMQQFAGAKDWTMLNRYSSLQKFQTERQTYTLAQTLPWFQQGLMAKELGQAAQDIWASNNRDTLVKAFGPGNLLGLGSGEKSFDDIYNMTKRDEEARQISPEQKATIMAEAAKGVDRIYSGQIPKETVSRFVEKNFSDGGSGLRDYMADLKGEAKSQFFEKLTSNNMTKAVLDTGNPKTISDYEKWMVDQFGALPNSINVGNRIKQMNAASGSVAAQANTYSYNPATYRFSVNPSPASQLPGNSANATVRGLQKATDTFNNDLYGLANFMRRMGVDPNGPQGIPKVLKDLEITNPSVDFKAFQSAISQGRVKGPTEATDVSGRAPATRVAGDTSEGTPGAPEGFDMEHYLSTAQKIENPGGDPEQMGGAGGLYKGNWQMSPANQRKYGYDKDAATAFTNDNMKDFANELGRPPNSEAEVYLAHQQGAKGAAELLANPEVPAGQIVGDRAIRLNGGDPNAPAKDFTDMWTARWSQVDKHQAQSNTKPVYTGDSLAAGAIRDKDGRGVAKVGANPTVVLENIQKLPDSDGGSVVLSSGASNDYSDGQLAKIADQVAALRAKGYADIHLMGVGDRKDFVENKVNEKLKAIAQKLGLVFEPIDPATLGPDRVHPTKYDDFKPNALADALPDGQNAKILNRPMTHPDFGQRNDKREQIEKGHSIGFENGRTGYDKSIAKMVAVGPDDNKLYSRTLADDDADEKFTSDEILKGIAKMDAAGAGRQSTNIEDRRDWYNEYMQTKDEHPFITGARYVSENGMTQGIRKLLGISADDQQATGEVGGQ